MSFSSSAGVYSSNAFLNPGPAPTPPDNKLSGKSLSSSIDNLNQYPPPPLPQAKRLNDASQYTHSPSGSDSSYVDSPSSLNGSPTSISTASTISNNATPSQRDDPKGRFIKHGWVVTKEDGSFKMWTRKYLALRDSYLEFYKNEVCISYLTIPVSYVP